MRYTNPIIPGFHPDPSICRVGNDYYLVTSTFEYFPGLPVFHSHDLVHWQQIGHAVNNPAYLDLSTAWSMGGLYAPTIRHHHGWFYVTCTNVSAGGQFIVKTQDPAGEWSAPIWIERGGIDPSLFFDDDGAVYYTRHSREGIAQAVINPDTGELKTPLKIISGPMSGKFPEGPHLYKINGTYYLMVAEGGTEYGHMESIGRSENPWGPFEACPRNPILSHRSQHNPIQLTGHGDLIQDHLGHWWIFFLAARPNGYQPVHHLGRETYLAPVHWDAGWPQIASVKLEMEAPLPPTVGVETFPARTCFNTPGLDLRWNFIRNPEPCSWSLTERPGCLRLRGLAATLSEVAPIAFIGRRQQHFNVKIAASLDFSPQTEKDEAGLVVRMNEGHHYEIFKSIRNGEPHLIIRRTIGTLTAETAVYPLPESAPASVLAIHADADWYRLGYLDGDTFVELDRAETRYLSSEVARGFTGVYFGMYATGNGQPCPAPADFAWFDYEPGDE